MTATKTRYWTFLIYPDDIKTDWLSFLNELHIPVAISPLHNKDINPDDTIKKPHFHIIVCFEGPTTYNNILDNICKPLGCYDDLDKKLYGITIPKRVLSLRGMYRYLTHLDNPEKYQYNQEDITTLGDFQLDMTESEITLIVKAIIDTINVKGFINYYELVNYYLELGDFDEFNVIKRNAYFFNTYLKEFKRK